MADLSDVSIALRDRIGATLYPNGTSSATTSAAGYPVRILVGWPGPQDVDAAIAAGTTLVTVYPHQSPERNTSRLQPDWQEASIPDPTYTLSVSGQTIVVGGAAPSVYFAQNVYAQISAVGYRYAAQAGDAAATVAAGLQALIAADWPDATVSGAVVTLPALARIEALRLGVVGTALQEVGRQERAWQIAIWSPSDDARTAVAKLIDPALRRTPRLLLADGAYGHLAYRETQVLDHLQKAGVFRRDLIYACEYGVTLTAAVEQIVACGQTLSAGVDAMAS